MAEDVAETAPDADSIAAYQALDIHTSLLIPLTFKQDVLAVLALHKRSHQKLMGRGAKLSWLTTLADQAALALSQNLDL